MRAAAAVAILIAAGLLVPIGARADALARPSLTVGDFWTYATQTEITTGVLLKGALTSRVADQETTAVAGASQDVYRVVLNGTGTASVTLPPAYGSVIVTASWTLTGEDLLESGQLKVVEALLGLTITGSSPFPFTIQVQNTSTYRILDDRWQFPLAPGASGSVAMAYDYSQSIFSSFFNTTTSEGNGTWDVAYAMDPQAPLTVPAGTFQAYPINETWPDGSVNRGFFSAAVGNDVRTESYNATGARTSTTNLTAYRYQAAEPPTFLGLTAVQWAVIAGTVAAAAVVSVLYLRRRKRGRARTAPESPPSP